MNTTIRLATLDDAEALLAIYAPFCADSPVSFEIAPPSLDDMRSRVEKILQILPWLVAESEGKVVGYAYASRHKERAAYVWSVDASIYLDERARGTGLGRRLYSVLFTLLKLQGFYNVVAGVTIPNPASEGLHRALGFETIGIYPGIGYKSGTWHDVLYLQLAIQKRPGEPTLPLDFAGVRKLPAWNEALKSG